MKTSKKILLGLVAFVGLVVIVGSVYWFSIPEGQRNMITFMAGSGESYESYTNYEVVEKNEGELESSFEVFEANQEEGDSDINIRTITEMVLNEASSMLKMGMVETIDSEDYTGWQMLADEYGSGENGYAYAPSPLSYYTAGLASNLNKQVIDAAKVLDIEIDNITVEVLNTFRWDDMSSVDGAGFLDVSTTNIIIESNASEEEIQSVVDLALNAWAAGNALADQIVVETHLIINGDNFETYYATPGTANSVDSYVDGLQLSTVTDEPVEPDYLELSDVEDPGVLEMINLMNNLEFEIYAISETVNSQERPYLNKVTVLAPSGETWVLYADEFMSDNDTPLAPTSLEYFTLGTSLCLTSQTTLVLAMMDLDYTDYRVEHMFEYSLEGLNTIEMSGNIDKVHTYIIIESNEKEEDLEEFFSRALSLCFAGEGLVGETEMIIDTYLNGEIID